MEERIEMAIAKANELAYSDYHIHAGIDRKASAKIWEKGSAKRAYITINCYTAAGNFKGSYKCGYIDMTSGEYVCTKYDDVDLGI